jgi:hypothetical protein
MAGTSKCCVAFAQVFIPFTVFGCLAILSGLLVVLMPETLGAGMPERVEVGMVVTGASIAQTRSHLLTFLFLL